MVTGNEYTFADIDEALKYVLEKGKRALTTAPCRQSPTFVVSSFLDMFSYSCTDELAKQAIVPVDSLDYPLTAWFNDTPDDKFVMTCFSSGHYSLKPYLRHRKFLF